MIQITNLDNKIETVFIGENRKEFLQYFNLIKQLNGEKNSSTNGWTVDKQFIELFKKQFDIEIVEQPWQQMGEQMLLPPFNYQKEAIWFGLNNLNCIQILPPGTGKTPITIGIYLELLKNNITNKPAIICTKSSLKYQWTKEIKKFSNLRAKAINTPSKAKKKFDSQFEDVDVLVLNYETLKNEKVYEKIREIEAESIFLDEIHYLGSTHKKAKAKALYRLNDLKIKIGFTATPITKDPTNLFTLFNMIKPDLFKSFSNFSRSYINYVSYGIVGGIKNLEHLKNRIAPYCFIKTEEQISKQLPKLMVNEIHCEMTNEMIKINKKIFDKLDELKTKASKYEKNNIDKSLEFDEEYQQIKAQILAHQTFAQELIDDPRLFDISDSTLSENYICKDKTSPKLNILFEVVENILNINSKICIFTKFERMQNIIQEELEKKFDIKCAIVNGSMSDKERYRQAYDLFQDSDDYKVLIATNAMNEGISLSKCNYLIEYDLADSYAMQKQRHGRVRRADSVNEISYVYQLIMDEENNNSWDQIAQKIIEKKKNYDNNLIQDLNRR